MPESSPPVLIIRLDAIGDALALTPLLAALHDAGVPVDLVMRAQNAGIFSARAARHVYEAPFALRCASAENRAQIEAFARTLRPNGYRTIMVATEDPGGYRLAHAIGARERIGFSNGWGKPLKTIWVRSLLTRTIYRSAGLDARAPHECDVLFALGRTILGDIPPPRDPRVLRPLVLDEEVAPDERVAIQITDKWERLGIALDDVVALAETLQRAEPIRLFAARGEAAYAQRFHDRSGLAVEYFDTLAPWKAAISAARALIAPDSGALHVAGMVGTPTVAVFPPIAQFALQTARWAPWAAPHHIVKAEKGWPTAAVAALASLYSVEQTTR